MSLALFCLGHFLVTFVSFRSLLGDHFVSFSVTSSPWLLFCTTTPPPPGGIVQKIRYLTELATKIGKHKCEILDSRRRLKQFQSDT